MVHVLGLPHTDTVPAWCTCAFTAKVGNLARMLAGEGHDVVLYAGEANAVAGVEHVPVFTAELRRRWFGGETWRDRVFDRWDPTDPCWVESNAALVGAMADRVTPGDVICCTIGNVQRAACDAFPAAVVVESGVGYEGSWAPYRCFESRAWQHWTYGRQGVDDGRFYDVVIPNAYDPADFGADGPPGSYVLFMGRMIERKGLGVVRALADAGVEVVTAGQGDARVPGARHAGVVRGDQRRRLLAGARALVCPTSYVEPFGGVAVEAQLSGTPVLSVPWGAFPETVTDGVTGFLCSTLPEFLDGLDACDRLDRARIRNRAVARWSLAAVAPRYTGWLERVAGVHGGPRGDWYGRVPSAAYARGGNP